MTSLGEKIIAIGERVISFEQRNNTSSQMIKVQCSHCGRWFRVAIKDQRAMNYCSECL